VNTYRATSPAAERVYGAGVVELDLSVTEEQDALGSGLLEQVPRTYRVLSDNFAAGEQGSNIDAAYPVETEAALISGGHLERVDVKSKPAVVKPAVQKPPKE
jgi:hypothetical protein